MAAAAAVLASVISVSLAVAARVTAPRLLRRFDGRSLWVFVLLFLLLAVPAICVGLCGYEWTSLLSRNSAPQQVGVWLVGQTVLTQPLLVGFLLWTHFQVETRELEFQQASGLSLRELAGFSFMKRFRLQYLLVVVFAFSFVWNEDTLNRVLSDTIPSMTDRLGSRVTGRGASSAEATSLVLFSAALSLLMIIVWNSLLSRAMSRSKTT
jgi:ABC-type tungstate transport system substrate-binding protein